MVVCPNCGAQLADGTKFCVNCGFKMAEERVQEAVTQVQQTAGNVANTVDQNVNQNVQQPYVNPAPVINQPNYAGQQVPPVMYGTPQTAAPAPSNNNGFAIGALVCGIISLLSAIMFCLIIPIFIGLVTGILAIAFAAVSKKKSSIGKMPGMGIAGLVLGILGLVPCAIIGVLMIIGVSVTGCTACTAGTADWESYINSLS